MKKRSAWPVIIALFAILPAGIVSSGCGKAGTTQQPATQPEAQTNPSTPTPLAVETVYFLRGEQPVAVTRNVSGGVEGALKELLKGPTAAEIQGGLSTQIPAGTKLNIYSAEGATAKADFSRELSDVAGGSARIQAIINQITKTVQANDPGIATVAITVEGQPVEDVLQP